MVTFNIPGVLGTDFALPIGDSHGELAGWNTIDKHWVTLVGGEWEYEIFVSNPPGKSGGRLKFKLG